MNRHEDYKEMLATHALDALEGMEARLLEDHLGACAECRDELASWQETAAALAFAAERAEPSAELRTRILDEARHTFEPRVLTGTTDAAPPAAAGEETATAAEPNVAQIRQRRARAWGSGQLFGAIAASLIIAALAIALALLWQRNNRMRAEVARLSEELNQTREERARLSRDKEMLTAPDSSMAVLGGTEMAASARARLAFDRKTGRAMLVADGLPQAPAGKAYQLWFIEEGKPPMPGGVFTTDANGHAELHDQMPSEGRNAAIFAVTLERAGGVPAPEGKAYLQGKAAS